MAVWPWRPRRPTLLGLVRCRTIRKMVNRIQPLLFLALCVLLPPAFGQNPATLRVEGIGGTAVTFSVSDLAGLPQQTWSAGDHGTSVTWGGVLLADVLAKVTTPAGEKFHHTAASYYLLAEGSDGYRAVFAWAELDPSFTDKAVYVVTKRDGKPLAESEGPFRLVVPGEKRNARSVRQLKLLRIEQPPAT